MQRIQDVIDRHISKGNQAVLNMLNTKYFIVPGPEEKPMVQQNPGATGSVWFVDTLVQVSNANAEIDSLTKINPAKTAFIHNEFGEYIKGFKGSKNGSIQLKSYAPNKLVYSSSSTSEQFAVFSEIWYGPNKGWQAFIDGQPVEHIRVNYLLRGMRIPAGNHEITYEFKPQSYFLGEKISMISSLLIIILLGFAIYLWAKKDTKLELNG